MPQVRRKLKRRIEGGGLPRLLTFSCYKRMCLLEDDKLKEVFLRNLESVRSRYGLHVMAYVLMPNHVHLAVWLPSSVSISLVMNAVKRPVTGRALAYFREARPEVLDCLRVSNPDREESYRFWQAGGGHDRLLSSSEEIWNAIEYIHQNPVAAGLAEDEVDYVWSSARTYHGLKCFMFECDMCDVWKGV